MIFLWGLLPVLILIFWDRYVVGWPWKLIKAEVITYLLITIVGLVIAGLIYI